MVNSISLVEVENLPNVVQTDSDGDLTMYCYKNDSRTHLLDKKTQQCRGLVFDSEGNLVSSAFGYTPTYVPVVGETETASEFGPIPPSLRDYLVENWGDCQVFRAYEGTLVRVFYHNSKWYVTTHRKLDANKSFWASRESFGSMFTRALETHDLTLESLTEGLDKTIQYVFLVLSTPENRIVCNPPPSRELFLVGCFKNGEKVECTDLRLPVQVPMKMEFDQLLVHVETMPPLHTPGVVVFLPNGSQIKICSTKYARLFELRGNEASVMFRYLQIRSTLADDFKALYPERQKDFENYESAISELILRILHLYRKRHISKEYFLVEKDEHVLIETLNKWYHENGRKTKVNYDTVKTLFEQANPSVVNRLVRREIRNAN